MSWGVSCGLGGACHEVWCVEWAWPACCEVWVVDWRHMSWSVMCGVSLTCMSWGVGWAQYGAVLSVSCAPSTMSSSHHINTASQQPSASASTVCSVCRHNVNSDLPLKSNLTHQQNLNNINTSFMLSFNIIALHHQTNYNPSSNSWLKTAKTPKVLHWGA